MTSIQGAAEGIPPGVGLLDRERIIARPGFNRWLVPPAALAIHLCIGMAYGFSVFWIPLSRAIGATPASTAIFLRVRQPNSGRCASSSAEVCAPTPGTCS